MAGKKAALYIRVSTDAQREEGYSIDAQRERLTAYCVAKGIEECDLYIDGGYTGSNLERPQMRRLIAEAKKGLLSHVVVYKLDRLSRSQKDTLYLIEDVFNVHGIHFVSMEESMDTATPLGRLMIGILSAFAQLERENIRERTRMGMRERVKSGLWMGGGRLPFGYDYDAKAGILVPNADADTVRQMYDLYIGGASASAIARMCGFAHDRLVTQILCRKSNTGVILYNGKEYPGKHAAIVPLEVYEQAMACMRARSKQPIRASENLLVGLLVCGKCGAKMRYQQWGKAGKKIYCYSQQTGQPHLVVDPNCDNMRHWATDIEAAVVEQLFRIPQIAAPQTNGAAQPVDVLGMLEKRKADLVAKRKRLYNLYAAGSDDVLLEAIQDNKAELEGLEQQLLREREKGEEAKATATSLERIREIADVWEYATVAEKRRLLRACIQRVVIDDMDVRVEFKFAAAQGQGNEGSGFDAQKCM